MKSWKRGFQFAKQLHYKRVIFTHNLLHINLDTINLLSRNLRNQIILLPLLISPNVKFSQVKDKLYYLFISY